MTPRSFHGTAGLPTSRLFMGEKNTFLTGLRHHHIPFPITGNSTQSQVIQNSNISRMLSLFIALFLPTPGALSSTRALNLSSKILVVFHSTHVFTMNFHASQLLLKLAPYLNTLFLFRFNFHHLLQKVCLNHHVRVSGPSLCSHNMPGILQF